MNAPAKRKYVRKKRTDITVREAQPIAPQEIISNLVLKGDIRGMSPEDKVKYYNSLCYSLKLNPLTQPFQILVLQGRETLYATKTATEQLRKINGISVERIEQKIERDICITTVIVKDKNGRTDGATGAVNVTNLKGDALANAIMKSETKAKRRATLSISGLGFLDESEIETVHGAQTEMIRITPEEPREEQKKEEPKTLEADEKEFNNIKNLMARAKENKNYKALIMVKENNREKIMNMIPAMRDELIAFYKNAARELETLSRN